MTKFHCTNCGQRIAVPDNSVGKKAECPKCGKRCSVPAVNVPSTKSVIKLFCFQCGQKIQVPQEHIGRKCRCPKCQAVNPVPSQGTQNDQKAENCIGDIHTVETPSETSRNLDALRLEEEYEISPIPSHEDPSGEDSSAPSHHVAPLPRVQVTERASFPRWLIAVIVLAAICPIGLILGFKGCDAYERYQKESRQRKRDEKYARQKVEREGERSKNEQDRHAQFKHDVVQSNYYDPFDTISVLSKAKLPVNGRVKTFESDAWFGIDLDKYMNLHDRISIEYASVSREGKFIKLKLRRTIDASLDVADEQKYNEEYSFDRNQNVIQIKRKGAYAEENIQVFHVYADQRNLLPKHDEFCEIRVYNRNGLLVEKITKEQHVIKYSYNQSNKIDAIITLDPEGKSYFKEEYQYSENGYSSKSIQYDKHYHINKKSLITEKVFGRDGRLTEYKLSDTDTSYTYIKKWEKHVYAADGTYSAVFWRHFEGKTGQYSEISKNMGWSQIVIYDDVKVSYSNTNGSLVESILISNNAKPLTNTKLWSDPKLLYMELRKYVQKGTESLTIGGEFNDIRSYYNVLDPQVNVIETRTNHKPATTKYTYDYDRNHNWITRHEKTLVSEYNTKQWKEDSRFERKRKIVYWN